MKNRVIHTAIIMLWLLPTKSFSQTGLDSIGVMLYDVNYEYKFTHTSCADLIYLSGIDYKEVGYDECYCDFVIRDKDELANFEQLVTSLKPEKKIENKDFLGMYVRVVIKFYYRDSTKIFAVDPKTSGSVYTNNWKFKKSRKVNKRILREIRRRYDLHECSQCPQLEGG